MRLGALFRRYAVACLGTALTDLQLELAISPLLAGAPSRTLVLALDADEAGQQATRRLYESGALARLNARGIDVRIATMPTPYKDPDEYVQASRGALRSQPAFAVGPDGAAAAAQAAGRAFETQVLDTAPTLPRMMATWSATDGLPRCMQVLDTAPSWVEWVGRSVLAPYQASRSTGQLEACVKELVALLSHLRTAVERSIHIHLFARLLAADDDTLAAQLRDDLHASLHLLSPPASSASSSSAAAPAPAPSSATTTARSAARAPARSAARPPLARLAELEVRLDELYVWSAVPDTLHWIATSSCAHERLRPRPPSLAELHSLPLCAICAVANEPADATAARLAAAAAAATGITTTTTTTPPAAAAAAAAAAIGSNVSGSRSRGTQLELDVDCHLMTGLACMCSPQRVHTHRYGAGARRST